ncbi:unnamed protein product [Oikopleura dioica]|uniref:Reverse transcriptase/retrotransposon-derived protein RNase H-like domain-containing protein n=1 Tax=Oikopleura dioica TaxID=34765 RepID=E4YPA6_OIKDI|nr:unnamed protein product [Oikopleura dioica]
MAALHKMLTKEYERFVWTESAEEAFKEVKAAVAGIEPLYHHNPKLPLFLTNDASGSGIGSCLYQLANDEMQPIGYFSKALRGPDLRRPTRQRELIALAEGIRHFEFYLINRRFTILSDHKSLTFLYKEHLRKKLDLRLANIWYYLADFNFTIKHAPGSDPVMFCADYLSRLPETSLALIEKEMKDPEIPDRVFTMVHFPNDEQLNNKDAHRDMYLRTLLSGPKVTQPKTDPDTLMLFGEVELSHKQLSDLQPRKWREQQINRKIPANQSRSLLNRKIIQPPGAD